MKLQPLGDRVVVKPDDEQDVRTPSGLVIPDTAKEKPQMGEIIAVGPGALNDDGERMPMDVKQGDKVLYSKFAGTEVKVEGVEYLVLSSRDLLAVVN
jgi:chaperonin GroES